MKKIKADDATAEAWSQSDLMGFAAAWAAIGIIIGATARHLIAPSYNDGYNAAKAIHNDYVSEHADSDWKSFCKGQESVKHEAAGKGAGRYEIDPESGEVYFKWLKSCDCKEGCKCTK